MENQLKDLEQHSNIAELSLEDLLALSDHILSDSHLKKGKKAKFIKHMDQIALISPALDDLQDQDLVLAAAALFKNLGRLGEHEESLQKGVQLLSKLKPFRAVTVRWLLQIAALKSSKKEHQECYDIAVRASNACREILEEALAHPEEENRSEGLFVARVLELSGEQTKDEIIWLVNERSLAEEMQEQIRKGSEPGLHVPYYPTEEFHIADYMSLEECGRGWEQEAGRQGVREVVTYLSICCFTMATEKYYLKDYSQKFNHLKALKVALCCFDLNCSYVAFLLKILHEHFGKRLQSIEEEHSETAERFEMRRLLPRDTREVSTRYIQFAD